MSLFEWIAERFNPGPVGKLQTANEAEEWQPRSRLVIWLLTLAGACVFALFVWGICTSENPFGWMLALAIYLLLARWLSPQHEPSNMGWFRGLMDNPFRISDDFNRLLFLFALFLLPGKLVLYAAYTLFNTIQSYRS